MGFLYGARFTWFDVRRQTAELAARISRWSMFNGCMLHGLVSYIWSNLDMRQNAWVGDAVSDIGLNLFCDGDFAGDTQTQRSTTGIHLAIHGPNILFPLIGQSAAQRAVATSTPEADVETMDWIRTRLVEIEKRRKAAAERRAKAAVSTLNEDDL